MALSSEAWTPNPGLAAFLADGDPPIVVSACTGAGVASTFFQREIEAARIANQRVILVTRFPGQIVQPLPAFAFLIDYAPFDKQFPHARGIIHNGGVGTMALAMRAGMAQIIVPFAYDQFFNGMRSAQLGGVVVVRRDRTTHELAKALVDLLESKPVSSVNVRLASQARETSGGVEEMAEMLAALTH